MVVYRGLRGRGPEKKDCDENTDLYSPDRIKDGGIAK